MRLSKPWQAMQWVNSSSLPRASGRSFLPWCMEMSLQRTMPCARARSCVRSWSAASVMPLFGSALKPTARICRRYSPAARFSTRYLPVLSDSTLTVILVLRLRACTKAPRNGLPSSPVTVPVMVAASAPDIAAMIEPTPSIRRVVARMDVPPGFELVCRSLPNPTSRRHQFAASARTDVSRLDHLAPAFELDLDALG